MQPSPPDTGRVDAAWTSPAMRSYRRIRGVAGEIRRTVPPLIGMLPRIATVTVQNLLGRSDYARWSNPRNLEQWWDSRTQAVARLIPPQSRVIEFGAGRCQLQNYLLEGCSYVPSDLTFRQAGTIVCDLNHRPLPDLRQVGADVAVFGGVLEYMKDLPSLVRWLAGQTTMAVASYDYLKSEPRTLGRAVELLRRRRFGYLNNYSLEQLTTVFAGAGFRCVTVEEWQTQKILVFSSHR